MAQVIRGIAGNGVIIPGDSFIEFLKEMAGDEEDDDTTWLFVKIYPSSLIIIPEPEAVASEVVGIPNPNIEVDVVV